MVGLLLLAVAWGGSASGAASPTLTLNVNSSGNLEVVLGNGTRLRTTSAPAAVIPPGAYLTLVASDVPDSRDIFHMFHLYGPGVNIVSDLLPCENPRPIQVVTLAPNATYTYEDTRNPQLAPILFTTSATGSSADTASSITAGSTAKSSGTISNTSVVGTSNGVAPFRGTLVGTVRAQGHLTLSRLGKAVSSLEAGRYALQIDDATARGGFSLQRLHGRLVRVTSSPFVGRHSMTIDLEPGQWLFFSGSSGPHRFRVVGS